MKTATVRSSISALLLAAVMLTAPAVSLASVFVSVAIAPPPLPAYTQPIAPGPGYLWTPGYWAYGVDGYYWVPGTWVTAPYIGALWTPGYWAWDGGFYGWHTGYWGPHVGFYGGINYGFGYVGTGYYGGYWNNGSFYYNRTVNNINVVNVRNVYNQPVINNTTVSRVSYNGGTGGISAQPTAQERAAERDQHRAATPMQLQHERAASINRAQLASVNHGAPPVAATARAAAFKDRGVGAPKVGAAGPGTSHVTPGQNASIVSSHVNKDVHVEPHNVHPSAPALAPQTVPHAQVQRHPAQGGGEHHEEGQRSR